MKIKKPKKEKMVRVSVRIPEKMLKILIKTYKGKLTASEIFKKMIEGELDAIRGPEAFAKLYNKLSKDFYGEPGISPESKGLRED